MRLETRFEAERSSRGATTVAAFLHLTAAVVLAIAAVFGPRPGRRMNITTSGGITTKVPTSAGWSTALKVRPARGGERRRRPPGWQAPPR
mgnify:CR=1 FL=1